MRGEEWCEKNFVDLPAPSCELPLDRRGRKGKKKGREMIIRTDGTASMGWPIPILSVTL